MIEIDKENSFEKKFLIDSKIELSKPILVRFQLRFVNIEFLY